jgi:hypothetical protein
LYNRNYTTDILENIETHEDSTENDAGEDTGYFSSYSRYGIHLEMLQVYKT